MLNFQVTILIVTILLVTVQLITYTQIFFIFVLLMVAALLVVVFIVAPLLVPLEIQYHPAVVFVLAQVQKVSHAPMVAQHLAVLLLLTQFLTVIMLQDF